MNEPITTTLIRLELDKCWFAVTQPLSFTVGSVGQEEIILSRCLVSFALNVIFLLFLRSILLLN